VPALERETEWRNHEVLREIGSRQYVDWRQIRHRDVGSSDVAEKVGQFCENIVEALRKPWVPPPPPVVVAKPQEADVRPAPPPSVPVIETSPSPAEAPQAPAQARGFIETKTFVDTSPQFQENASGRETTYVTGLSPSLRTGTETRIETPYPKLVLSPQMLLGFAAVLLAIGGLIWFLIPHGPSMTGEKPVLPMTGKSPTSAGVSCSGFALASLSARAPAPLSAREECALKPKDEFKECANCPTMVIIPPGSYNIGSPANEAGHDKAEDPRHPITIAKPLAVGKFDVTRDEFSAFVADTGYDAGAKCYVWTGQWDEKANVSWRTPGFAQSGTDPVVCVHWNDAGAYVNWLNKKTNKDYRLLSESEWEYAARAGTTTAYYWGNEIGSNNANCFSCGSQWDNKSTSPSGSFKPNDFGLYDMTGNVWQWTEDCWNPSYDGAPADGAAWLVGDCNNRVARGGAWDYAPTQLRSAFREKSGAVNRDYNLGIRVGRTLTP